MPTFLCDPELEDRRALLQAATKGNASAQQKLEEEYHVRVYSASECEKYAVTMQIDNMPSAVRRKLDYIIKPDDHTEEEQF